MRNLIVPLLTALLLSAAAIAAEVPFQPYADAPITKEQWQAYRSKVEAAFGASAQARQTEQALMYFDEKNRTQYIFTVPGNPAHPAWIARRIVTHDGMSVIEQVGYYAGSQRAFASWFAAFQQQNEAERAK